LFVRSLIANDKWKLDAAQEIKATGKKDGAGDACERNLRIGG